MEAGICGLVRGQLINLYVETEVIVRLSERLTINLLTVKLLLV